MSKYCLLLVLFILIIRTLIPVQAQYAKPFGSEHKMTTLEYVTSRGFLAKNHELVSDDGYILNLVQCNNPLVNGGRTGGAPNKDPILMLHGSTPNANIFIQNSVGAHPNDYSSYNASSLTPEELDRLIGDDPNSKSIAFTALNFGHEVWLLNRRGTSQSCRHVHYDCRQLNLGDSIKTVAESLFDGIPIPILSDFKLINKRRKRATDFLEPEKMFQRFMKEASNTNEVLKNMEKIGSTIEPLKLVGDTMNPKYWNFSLDEQIKYDMPMVLDHILKTSKRRKISLLGNSAGSTIILMTLIHYPKYNDKVSRAVLWAPALIPSVPMAKDSKEIREFLEVGLMNYIGPLPLTSLSPTIRVYGSIICGMNHTDLCHNFLQNSFGFMGDQQKIYDLENWSGLFDSVSSHDFLQSLQAGLGGEMRYFDYQDPLKNLIAYGQIKPPLYDTKRITLRTISMWGGLTDSTTGIEDIKKTIAGMKVPVKEFYIGDNQTFFSHLSFFFHRNVSRLINIPTLRELEAGD